MNEKEAAEKFIENLKKRSDNAGEMSRLRKRLMSIRSPDQSGLAVVYSCMPKGFDASSHFVHMAYFVAALFAYYPSHNSKAGNFGNSMRKLYQKRDSEATNKRMLFLAQADRDKAMKIVQTMTRSMKSEDISIDYAQLICDLFYWSNKFKANSVQSRWLKSYYYKQSETAA